MAAQEALTQAATLGSAGMTVGGPIGAGIGATIGALMGMFDGSADQKRKAAEAYLQQISDLGVPNPSDFVSKYGVVDVNDVEKLQPILEKEIALGDTNLKNIQLDPALKQAKMNVLAKMQQQSETGMTPEEEMQANKITRQAGAGVKSANENVLQEMARRGTLGGGAELQARIANANSGYDQAAEQGLGLMAERNKRAYAAALGAGNFASNMEDTDYSRQAAEQGARDRIAQFNTSNSINTNRNNTTAMNDASRDALHRKNQLIDYNTTNRDKQADQLAAGTVGSMKASNDKKITLAKGNQDLGNSNAQATNDRSTGLGKVATGIGSMYDAYNLPTTDSKKKKQVVY